MSKAADRRREAVRLKLRGYRVANIAEALDVTPMTVYADLRAARESGEFLVRVRVLGVDGVDMADVAAYVRTQLEAAGVTMGGRDG